MINQPGQGNKQLPKVRERPIDIPNKITAMPMQIGGLMQLIPCGALSAIQSCDCFVIVQCIEILEIFTGFETSNRYVIYDSFMRPLLYAFEKSNIFARQLSETGHNWVMNIVDIYGQPFMLSIRKNGCCNDDLITEYPPGNLIGITRRSSCSSSFTMGINGCSQPFLVQTPCCVYPACSSTRFPVVSASGGLFAEIVRLYPGYFQEIISDADTYIVNFPAAMPPHLKLAILSAVFLIDFTYFEETSKKKY